MRKQDQAAGLRRMLARTTMRVLPLVSVLGMIWIYQETHDIPRIAEHSQATFWFVLPSLPMFLILPAMLRHGVGFYLALTINCAITALLYLAMVKAGAFFGVKF